jgi:tetratricopeptide (TPR) repeat protein
MISNGCSKFGFLCSLAFFLLVTISAGASSNSEICSSPGFSLSPSAMLQNASVPEQNTSLGAVVLCQQDSYVFASDGSAVENFRFVFKVFTQSAAESWGQLESRWEPWHENKHKIRARVITPTGEEHWLDQKTFSETTAQDESEDVYTDARNIRAPLPAMMPGSIVEEEFVIAESAPLFDASTVRSFAVSRSVPMLYSRFSIDAPANLPIRYQQTHLPQLQVTTSEKDGRRTLTFENGPLAPSEDLESNGPGDAAQAAHLEFSTGKDWNGIATRYSSAVDQRLQGSDLSRLVLPAKNSKYERPVLIAKLLAILHKEVRYTGVEFGEDAILPNSPASVLQRKYGDCKDKSTLLVGMLRAAGIPAYLALLQTGPGLDTFDSLPGMSFDHAIVYVPGAPEYWIDATAAYFRLGSLPGADQGRKALIARPETTALVLTPETPSSANTQVETREFYLPEDGSARVIETTELNGNTEAGYRDDYVNGDPKEIKKNLQKYVKEAYLTELAPKYELSDLDNVSKPFRLRIEIEKGARGSVDGTGAVVAIPLWAIADRLPDELKDDDKSTESKERHFDLVFPSAFVTEWRYKIVPPPGYKLRSTPDAAPLAFGPATLTKEFHQLADGSVGATIRLDTGKRRWTPQEVKSATSSLLQLKNADPLLIRFDQIGWAMLQAGNFRSALEEYSRLATQHPKEVLHHLQLADALLAAGSGGAARAEARKATELDPASAKAFQKLGWTLRHDLIGRQFEKGWDRAGAVAAYRKARQLDPADTAIAADFAILLEHDESGIRYSSKADLDGAITEYEGIKSQLPAFNLADNLPFALMYARRFKELEAAARALPKTLEHDSMIVTAIAALKGTDAAIDAVTQLTADPATASKTLATSANYLLHLRMYSECATLAEAGARGTERAATVLAFSGMVRKTKVRGESPYPADDPRSLVWKSLAGMFDPEGMKEDYLDLFYSSQRSDSADSRKKRLEAFQNSAKQLRQTMKAQQVPWEVIADLGLGAAQITIEESAPVGYKMRLVSAGQDPRTLYVVRDKGDLRLTAEDSVSELGVQALARIDAGDLAGARTWLDWARERVGYSGTDDPLGAAYFAAFWSKGDDVDKAKVRYAAAALAADDAAPDLAIPILLEGWQLSDSDVAKLKFDRALTRAYLKSKKYDEMLKYALRQKTLYPDSVVAFELCNSAWLNLNDLSNVETSAKTRLQKFPNDQNALRALMGVASRRSEFKHIRSLADQLISSGHGAAGEYNNSGWSTLFDGTLNEEAIAIAQRGTQLSQTPNAPLLHTLASMYAEAGKTTEARQVVLQAMSAWQLEEPNSVCWYVFGRIAEQYGIKEEAINAYRKVEAPQSKFDIPGSTYALAQNRLKLLGAQ